MLDSMFSSLRRGVERARVRGEEAYQVGRLRLEIFNLHREEDVLFGRLGRAYHGGADVAVLEQIQVELRRVDEEVRTREALIEELNRPAPEEPVPGPASPSRTVILPAGTPPITATVSPGPPEVHPMTDDHKTPIDATDTGEVERDSAVDANDTSDDAQMEAGIYDDPDSPDIPQDPLTDVVTEAAQRREVHKNSLREGEMASENPDPLGK